MVGMPGKHLIQAGIHNSPKTFRPKTVQLENCSLCHETRQCFCCFYSWVKDNSYSIVNEIEYT
jgi:hypothetical protein